MSAEVPWNTRDDQVWSWQFYGEVASSREDANTKMYLLVHSRLSRRNEILLRPVHWLLLAISQVLSRLAITKTKGKICVIRRQKINLRRYESAVVGEAAGGRCAQLGVIIVSCAVILEPPRSSDYLR